MLNRMGVCALAICLLLALGCADATTSPGSANAEPAAATNGKGVDLIVDYGGGTEKRFKGLPWTEGMTIAGAMDEAAKRPPGIEISTTGTGEMVLLLGIDGVSNEGAGEDDRNWRYRVNDKPGDRSFAAYKLEAGDAILWTYSRNGKF